MKFLRRSRVGAMNVIPPMSDSKLCPEAEGILNIAIGDKAVTVVNETFLFKFYGRTAGVAIRSDVNSGVEAGHWYYPMENAVRENLRRGFLDGKPHLTFKEPTTWVYLRPVDPKDLVGEQSLILAETVANLSPETMMQGRAEREAYWQRNREFFARR